MRIQRQVLVLLLIALLAGLVVPSAILGDEPTWLIAADVLLSAEMPAEDSSSLLLVQATSWGVSPYRYIITLTNLSPWSMAYLRLLDRYLPEDPKQAEVDHQWWPERLEPSHAISFVAEFPEGPLKDGCHQIEISLADGLDTILMDCGGPSGTTVWQVPLTAEMEDYLALPPLTLETPEGGSKIGLHVTHNSSPAIMEFVEEANPRVVVAVGDLGWLSSVKERSPGTVTIGRLLEGDQSLYGDPVERARTYVEKHAGQFLANPGVDYWLGWNEPVVNTPEKMAWYAAFESERILALEDLGLKAAIGNFSVGTPEGFAFEPFLSAIRTAKEHGALLALHEYSAPTMRDGIGAEVPGLRAATDSGALTLRYRYWYQHYLAPNNLVVPLVITEAGIDGGVLSHQSTEYGGWRNFVPSGNRGIAAYLEQIAWYDSELRRDPHVLGFAIFNAGEPNGAWSSFDITGILPELAEQAQSVK